MDQKNLVVRKEFTLKNAVCYRYPCSKCGKVSFLPQLVVKAFDLPAPKNWACVAINDDREYYCEKCASEIGIGI